MADRAWATAVAAIGLTGADAPVVAPPGSAWLADLAAHRLVGVLAGAVADGAVMLEAAAHEALCVAHEEAMRAVLLLEDELLAAVEVLDGVGIETRLLKGAALAHMVHADPSERTFGDNDLLVRSSDIDRAVAALVDAGATRTAPSVSADFDRRFAKSVTLRWSTTELDVHRTLAPGPYGHLVVTEDLWRSPADVLLAGRAVPTLPADLHLLHGALHVALGDVEPRLGNVRDVALLAARTSIDTEAVISTAARWRCTAPLAIGLRATQTLGHTRSSLERWADGMVPDPVDRRRFSAYDRRDGRYRRQALATLRVLGWRDRIAFIAALGRRRVRPGE